MLRLNAAAKRCGLTQVLEFTMKLFCIPLLLLLVSGCTSERDKAIEKAKQSAAEALKDTKPSNSLKAFGGTVYGKDLGEWGGEIGFAPVLGNPYQLVPENSAGLFSLNNRVIAFTGLLHMGANYGHVFELTTAPNGKVKATKVLDLPAAPCDAKEVDGSVLFRSVTGYERVPNGVGREIFTCYTLDSALNLKSMACPSNLPQYCKA